MTSLSNIFNSYIRGIDISNEIATNTQLIDSEIQAFDPQIADWENRIEQIPDFAEQEICLLERSILAEKSYATIKLIRDLKHIQFALNQIPSMER